MWRRHVAAAVLMFCCSVAHAQSSGTPGIPEANPARPTVANPATLTPVGYLQFENGVLWAEGNSSEFSGRFGINQVTKLAVHPRLELLLDSEPYVFSGLNGVRGSDSGDVFAGAQVVLLPGNETKPTVSINYLRHIYAGTAPDLDSGTAENSLVVLLSDDLRGFHFDLNGMFNEQKQGLARRAQFGQTISISRALGKFGVGGELWHFTQPFLRGNAVGNLWSVSYQARPNLVFDAGFDHGLTSTSTSWEVFAGFTYLLPHRLWKKK